MDTAERTRLDKHDPAQSRAYGLPESPKQPQFMLVPSLACHANCAYCFSTRDGPGMSPEMVDESLEFISGVAREAKQEKVRVTLHGGEPLMAGRGILRRVLEGLRARFGRGRYEVALQSNLWLLDDEFCELFVEHNVEIGTSIDGPEDVTDAQRGGSYFARTMQGIKLAREHGLRVGCITTFTPFSAPRWREVFDFFRKERLGVSIHASVPCVGAGNGKHSLAPEQYASLLMEALDYYLEHSSEMVISSLDQMCQGVAFAEEKVCTFRNCLGMFLAIDPHGGIYPCQRFWGMTAYRLGNLADNPTLSDLLNSPMARRMAYRQAAVCNACGECEHIDYCRGGCPYNAWSGGDLTRVKDPYCEAYLAVFDDVKQRLAQEMRSKENVAAIAQRPFAQDGHPLLRTGPISELIQRSARAVWRS